MKEVIGKGKLVNKCWSETSTHEISQSQRSFEMYLKGSESSFEEVTLSDEDIKTAFFSLKGGKSPGFDEILTL